MSVSEHRRLGRWENELGYPMTDLFFKSSLEDMFIDLRERDIVREKHPLVASHSHPS